MKHARTLLTSAALLGGLIAALPAAAQSIVAAAPFGGIKLEGGGHVTLKHGSVQQVRLVKGSTQYTRFTVDSDNPHTLRIDACNSDCPHQYDLEIEITSPSIDALAIEGGGSIVSEGTFPELHQLNVAIEGGGVIDSRAMPSAAVNAAVEGGGVIRVKADNDLSAAVEGGGQITYWGNPKVSQAIEGGGKVERGD
jgi:hypothetical protein